MFKFTSKLNYEIVPKFPEVALNRHDKELSTA